MPTLRSHLLGAAIVGAVLLALTAVPVEAASCKAVSKLPAIIAKPGAYCLSKDLTASFASGRAIEIASDDVVLDLGGFTLHGTGLPDTQTVGVFGIDRRNVTVRNGTIDGFLIGVQLTVTDLATSGSQGHLVEDVHVERSTWFGISVAGRGDVVRRNRVVATGGSTVSALTAGNAVGIVAAGAMSQVYDNDVLDTVETTGVAVGIQLESGLRSVVERNRIAGVGAALSGPLTNKYVGIKLRFSPQSLVATNRIMGSLEYGIDCATVLSPPADYCLCRDNVSHKTNQMLVSGHGCLDETGNYP